MRITAARRHVKTARSQAVCGVSLRRVGY